MLIGPVMLIPVAPPSASYTNLAVHLLPGPANSSRQLHSPRLKQNTRSYLRQPEISPIYEDYLKSYKLTIILQPQFCATI
jgi:hypothetical protein